MRPGLHPWVDKIPWRREWLPTPVFLPEEPQGQRSLMGYSPWGPKELDTTEWLTLLTIYIVFTTTYITLDIVSNLQMVLSTWENYKQKLHFI